MSAGLGVGTTISIIAASCGGLLMLIVAHAGEPKHAEAASEKDVTGIALKLERVATDVDNNKGVLSELKDDLSTLRVEQRISTESILRAIEAR